MRLLLTLILCLSAVSHVAAQTTNEINVSGTTFLLNGTPFPYTGVSFFNAIYNPNFNRSAEELLKRMQKFRLCCINVLRVSALWGNKRGFVDTCSECTL